MLEDPIEQPEHPLGEAPEVFLKTLGESLKMNDGIDVELADVLIKHLLVVSPIPTAVAQAKAAILDLGDRRAKAIGTDL